MDLLSRYRRGLTGGLALGLLTYGVLSLRAEIDRVLEHLLAFEWIYILPVLALSLVNYMLRFVRWEYYLRRLHLRVELKQSLTVFLSGMAMTITPGKAGELLKALLMRELVKTPLLRTASVVVVERLTDFVALILLAGLGVGTYYPEHAGWLVGLGCLLFAGIGVLNLRGLTLRILAMSARIPGIGKLVPRLEETYLAALELLRPLPLAWGVVLATLAWGAECLGFYVVYNGHGVDASLRICTFLYAFSTLVGVASPGGLVVTDASLGEGAVLLIPGLSPSLATAAAFVIRLCTLWFAVLVGSLALLRFRGPVLEHVAKGAPVLDEGRPGQASGDG